MKLTAQVLIGVVLMAGGGAQAGIFLGRGLWGSAALICFALGIIAIATGAVRGLADRVAHLERELAAVRAAGNG